MQVSRGYKEAGVKRLTLTSILFLKNTNISSLTNFSWRLKAFDQLKDNSFVYHKDLGR